MPGSSQSAAEAEAAVTAAEEDVDADDEEEEKGLFVDHHETSHHLASPVHWWFHCGCYL